MTSLAAQRAAVAPLARAELARRHLADFVGLLVPSYQRTAHTEALCAALEGLEAREINRAIICMPPRHGKTLHVSQAFPAWVLGRHPEAQVILASYAAELAEQNSRRARGFMLDLRWPFPSVSVSAESAAVGRWGTTKNGLVIAAGVAGGLTGFGADVAVVDDAIRDRQDADSEAVRNSTWSWFTEVLMTRLQPRAAVLVMGTRWHEDDLIGRILSSSSAAEWEVLSLPAVAEEDDPLGRDEGQPLWPDWFDADYLARLREQLGERAFASLYQQRPTPAVGAVFQRAWLDGRYRKMPNGMRIVAALDASFKTGTSSDYSAIVTVGTDGRHFLVLDVWRRKVEFPELLAAVRAEASEWNPEAILVEDAAAGQSAIQALKRESLLPIVPVKPEGSKVARAEGVSPLFEAARVLFPETAPSWLGPLVEELVGFPAGRHDDMVDAFVYALARLRRHGGTGAGATIEGEPLLGIGERLGDSSGITADTQF